MIILGLYPLRRRSTKKHVVLPRVYLMLRAADIGAGLSVTEQEFARFVARELAREECARKLRVEAGASYRRFGQA
jgi:hypothetical protein